MISSLLSYPSLARRKRDRWSEATAGMRAEDEDNSLTLAAIVPPPAWKDKRVGHACNITGLADDDEVTKIWMVIR
ncbi:MAG: hypothetical protein DRI52_00950 [Chloroflexi bacterium]|nr:MAG: hypothetical protein DRI52_00950 [Chloroflexota bacterium]